MKNLENNGRLKKVIALLLVTTMVVGILSSAAVKLVASTYYMQTKRKLKTNIPVVDQIIDNIVDDNNVAGPETTAPAATTAPWWSGLKWSAPTPSMVWTNLVPPTFFKSKSYLSKISADNISFDSINHKPRQCL